MGPSLTLPKGAAGEVTLPHQPPVVDGEGRRGGRPPGGISATVRPTGAALG